MFSLLFIMLNPNCSYLNDTSVAPQSSIWGTPKQIAALQQNYYNRTRALDLDNSYINQYTYYQTFSGRSSTYQDLYIALRKTQTDSYVNNVRQSEKNGSISPEVSYGAAALSSVGGNPVKTQVGEVHLSQNLNVVNGTSDTTVESGSFKVNLSVNARSARDAPTASVNNTEFYQAKVESPLVLGWSTSSIYGGTTGQLQVSASHELSNNVVFVVNKTWENNNMIAAELSGKIGYGISF